jgi:hypothetical protein
MTLRTLAFTSIVAAIAVASLTGCDQMKSLFGKSNTAGPAKDEKGPVQTPPKQDKGPPPLPKE